MHLKFHGLHFREQDNELTKQRMNMFKISRKTHAYVILRVTRYFYFCSKEVIMTIKIFLLSYQDVVLGFEKLEVKVQKSILNVRTQRRFSSRLTALVK